MATLIVDTAPATDFRGDSTPGVTDILFTNRAAAQGTFNAFQFGAGISNSVEITGNRSTNIVGVVMSGDTAFSAAGWTFANWSADDSVRITGLVSAETITGSSQRNIIVGGGGADHLTGGASNDSFFYSPLDIAAGETVDGKGGFDEIEISNGLFALASIAISNMEGLRIIPAGGFGTTVVLTGSQIGSTAIAHVAGGIGPQELIINGSTVNLSGVSFTSWTAEDKVRLNGSKENDALVGSHVADTLNGNQGDDSLNGGGGADLMVGGAGNDHYFVEDAGDIVDESAAKDSGIDTIVSLIDFSLADSVHVRGAIENLTLTRSAIRGTGNAADNAVTGNSLGNVIAGNLGNDILTGAAGRDTFLFDTKPNKATNVDHVTDMVHLTDFIELDHTIFTKLKIGSGHLKKGAFFAEAGAHHGHDGSDRIVYDKTSGALFYDKDGSGHSKGKLFAILDGSPDDVNAKDFLIVA